MNFERRGSLDEGVKDNDASKLAEAMSWVSRITSVCGIFALPPVGGMWLDKTIGTLPLFVVLGALIGFGGGMYSLIKMVECKND